MQTNHGKFSMKKYFFFFKSFKKFFDSMYADCSLHYRFHNIGRWFEAEEA